MAWARRIATEGLVRLVEDEAGLAAAVAEAAGAPPAGIAPAAALVHDLRALVADARHARALAS
jgi:predicted HD phosphohydrolase